MAMRKDWRDAVSSGGTDARSRPGGEPGAAVAGGPYDEFWPCERALWALWILCSLGGAAERSLGAFSLFSVSLPLPPDFVSNAPALLPLRFEPLLRLPTNEEKRRQEKRSTSSTVSNSASNMQECKKCRHLSIRATLPNHVLFCLNR